MVVSIDMIRTINLDRNILSLSIALESLYITVIEQCNNNLFD